MTPREFTALIVRSLDAAGVEHIVVGSVAAMFYGEMRATADVDIVARLSRGQAKAIRDAFPEPEFYLSEEALAEVLVQGGQFNVIHTGSVFRADIVCARSDAFHDAQFQRARTVNLLRDTRVRVASPEDVTS